MKNRQRIIDTNHILLFWEQPDKEQEKEEKIYDLDLPVIEEPKIKRYHYSYEKIFDERYKIKKKKYEEI